MNDLTFGFFYPSFHSTHNAIDCDSSTIPVLD
jgi:hypothetical protein